MMPESIAAQLAMWAHDYHPTDDDLALSLRSLIDTVAVILAARTDPLVSIVAELCETARWSALAHVLSFDDLHLPSTAHISAICVPVTLSCGGGYRAHLAAAGVMARLGNALGWSHYSNGWHSTCTAGAPAAAVAAAVSLGLSPQQTAMAIALAVPAASGVQRAFGTSAKALQVAFVADAGVRAARLVLAGADANPYALDQWFNLVGADPADLCLSGPAVPGGLAVKLFPCCYSMQRPISAIRTLMAEAPLDLPIKQIRVTATESSVRPLIYHRPRTGAEGKFSLEYAIAATLLDTFPGFASFTTPSVMRAKAHNLMSRTIVQILDGGEGLLDGEINVALEFDDGTLRSSSLRLPPGAPTKPPTADELRGKFLSCGPDVPSLLLGLDWTSAATLLRTQSLLTSMSQAARCWSLFVLGPVFGLHVRFGSGGRRGVLPGVVGAENLCHLAGCSADHWMLGPRPACARPVLACRSVG
jgi:2-methylcitrate dehydratase PrpD